MSSEKNKHNGVIKYNLIQPLNCCIQRRLFKSPNLPVGKLRDGIVTAQGL